MKPGLFEERPVKVVSPNVRYVGDIVDTYLGQLGWLRLRCVGAYPTPSYVPVFR